MWPSPLLNGMLANLAPRSDHAMASETANLHRVFARLRDYWVLTKPEVNSLVLIATAVGFDLGWRGPLRLVPVLNTLLGTLLVASGTATLNQYLERSFDARMRRTARRPLPAGRVSSAEALTLGLALAVAGVAYLAISVNLLASALAAGTLLSYLAVYTPLKRRSAWCMFVGAFPGAAPPLIGYAAARGTLNVEAWILFGMVFLWQFPHFLSIAWMYREDYSRAGYRMLPPDDEGRSMAWQMVIASLVLLPVSLAPAWLGVAGLPYLLGALIVGLAFSGFGMHLAMTRSRALARRVLLASVVYLPIVFGLLMLDKTTAV